MTFDSDIPTRVLAGDKTAVAAALNLIENRRPDVQAQVAELLGALRRERAPDVGHRIGLTGPPGVGKSTLTAALARELRGRGKRVGVVAVDPSSVRSGGALLGDRARMGFDPADQGLFVRSLATGGDAGGLAYAVPASVEVLAAAYDLVLVETTGVGQTETDVEHVVDTVALVIQPGSGDVLQFIKAGIMEIPDVLVVNKGDHKRLATRAASDLTGALDTLAGVGMGAAGWQVPVRITSARDRTGIGELVDSLFAHRAAVVGAGQLEARRTSGAASWASSIFKRNHGEHGLRTLGGGAEIRAEVLRLLGAGHPPPSVAAALSQRYLAAVRH